MMGSRRPLKRNTARAVASLFSAVALFSAAGCATLPTSTEPHVIETFEGRPDPQLDLEPTKDAEPDLLLREFFAASANPSVNYEAARRYLTQPMGQAWEPSEDILVLDTFELTSRPMTDQEKRSYQVEGRIIGRLGPGGVFHPENQLYQATMELVLEDGQWRIESLPNDVVVDRIELRNHYEPRNVYFYDSTGQALAPDRRWVYSAGVSREDAMLNMLIEGPSNVIAPAVTNAAASDLTYTGSNDGVYRFTGGADTDDKTRARFAAQVVWTLASAGVPGPYPVTLNGVPLVGEKTELTTDEFRDLDPVKTRDGGPELYTLSDGAVTSLSNLGDGEEPVVEPVESFKELGSISSVDIGDKGNYAAVSNVSDNEQALILGVVDSGSKEVQRAGSFTRPTLEPDHASAWVVADGKGVIRAERSTATEEVNVSSVQVELPEDVDGEITVLRLSSSGARVAMIVDGHLVVGVVERRENGQRAVVNTAKYAESELGGAAVSVDWQPDGSLLVGTSATQRPIVRVEQDGSTVTALPSGNVGGPVVAVAATADMMYITDSKVLMRMPLPTRDSLNWREVPGQQGVRAAPVVPRP
ncbi:MULTISPECIES: LpqB family beta-propeller domain-containing protein [unclassified Corynebacterium]|uniref:LpqB family beta-propeller domain-containing protein n=1 Tax=unclassified Corynebacterium TaxID=2624378 RepID=UPI00264F2E32|nr:MULTISPECIES: LpqB family beta-propeller domain-containing protein [unclassified Corynebacterium]MDN8595133.1 LpqB family beta-propeller domain-containing protein [Corynebacterium sp. P4_F2]WKK56631.1 LpqB family beta-propeller domain-containing protein [Corynebacterium sp. P4-C1]